MGQFDGLAFTLSQDDQSWSWRVLSAEGETIDRGAAPTRQYAEAEVRSALERADRDL